MLFYLKSFLNSLLFVLMLIIFKFNSLYIEKRFYIRQLDYSANKQPKESLVYKDILQYLNENTNIEVYSDFKINILYYFDIIRLYKVNLNNNNLVLKSKNSILDKNSIDNDIIYQYTFNDRMSNNYIDINIILKEPTNYTMLMEYSLDKNNYSDMSLLFKDFLTNKPGCNFNILVSKFNFNNKNSKYLDYLIPCSIFNSFIMLIIIVIWGIYLYKMNNYCSPMHKLNIFAFTGRFVLTIILNINLIIIFKSKYIYFINIYCH